MPAYRFSVAGTAVLVGYRGMIFILTAKHVVGDCSINRVAIFPCEGAKRAIPVPQSWRVVDEASDPDSSDLLVMLADISNIPQPIRKGTSVVHLTPPGAAEWFDDRFSSTFFLFGYPKAMNWVDYKNDTINLAQAFLRGRYIGHSISDGCHEAEFDNPLSIPNFDGLSGSPVFSVPNVIGPTPQPRFCGLALRGGAASKRIHFIEASRILLALDEAVDASTNSRASK